MIDALLVALAAYASLGLVASVWLLTLGLVRTDPALASSPRRVRLILLPGCVALWPLLLVHTIRAPKKDLP